VTRHPPQQGAQGRTRSCLAALNVQGDSRPRARGVTAHEWRPQATARPFARSSQRSPHGPQRTKPAGQSTLVMGHSRAPCPGAFQGQPSSFGPRRRKPWAGRKLSQARTRPGHRQSESAKASAVCTRRLLSPGGQAGPALSFTRSQPSPQRRGPVQVSWGTLWLTGRRLEWQTVSRAVPPRAQPGGAHGRHCWEGPGPATQSRPLGWVARPCAKSPPRRAGLAGTRRNHGPRAASHTARLSVEDPQKRKEAGG
jgi:hypothetical protein